MTIGVYNGEEKESLKHFVPLMNALDELVGVTTFIYSLIIELLFGRSNSRNGNKFIDH